MWQTDAHSPLLISYYDDLTRPQDTDEDQGRALLDIDLLFRKNIKGEMAERAEEFHVLTEETGGNLALPASGEAMILEAHEIAKDINSQYVMSYSRSMHQGPLSIAGLRSSRGAWD